MIQKVSVIIPTYNRSDLLLSLLGSLGNNYEVIVIDDASTDDTVKLVKEKYPKTKIYSFEKNHGPAFAKNFGFLKSTGDFILFLDSDTELVKKDSIEKGVELLLRDKSIGQIGGEISGKTVTGRKRKNVKRMNTELVCVSSGIKDCDYIPTSNCLMFSKTLKKIGGFDPFYVYPGEDVDLGWRLQKAGYRNIVSFDAGALHKFSEHERMSRAYTYYRAQMRFTLKYFGIWEAIKNPFWDMWEEYWPMVKGRLMRRKNGEKNNKAVLEVPKQNYYIFTIPFCLIKAYLWNMTRPINNKENYLNEDFYKNTKIS